MGNLYCHEKQTNNGSALVWRKDCKCENVHVTSGTLRQYSIKNIMKCHKYYEAIKVLLHHFIPKFHVIKVLSLLMHAKNSF